MNSYYQSINDLILKSTFMKNFYQIMLSEYLISIAVGMTVANSFTDIVKAINTGLILPILTIFSKNKQVFQFSPIISSVFMFVLVTFLVYVFILTPINSLRNVFIYNNTNNNTNINEEKKN
jgi:large-conductance mechanosensitive channel